MLWLSSSGGKAVHVPDFRTKVGEERFDAQGAAGDPLQEVGG